MYCCALLIADVCEFCGAEAEIQLNNARNAGFLKMKMMGNGDGIWNCKL